MLLSKLWWPFVTICLTDASILGFIWKAKPRSLSVPVPYVLPLFRMIPPCATAAAFSPDPVPPSLPQIPPPPPAPLAPGGTISYPLVLVVSTPVWGINTLSTGHVPYHHTPVPALVSDTHPLCVPLTVPGLRLFLEPFLLHFLPPCSLHSFPILAPVLRITYLCRLSSSHHSPTQPFIPPHMPPLRLHPPLTIPLPTSTLLLWCLPWSKPLGLCP